MYRIICDCVDYKDRIYINFENVVNCIEVFDELLRECRNNPEFMDVDQAGVASTEYYDEISWSDIGDFKREFEHICDKLNIEILWL